MPQIRMVTHGGDIVSDEPENQQACFVGQIAINLGLLDPANVGTPNDPTNYETIWNISHHFFDLEKLIDNEAITTVHFNDEYAISYEQVLSFAHRHYDQFADVEIDI